MSNATQPAALFPGQGSHTPEMRDLVSQRAPGLRAGLEQARGRVRAEASSALKGVPFETPAEGLVHA